MNARFPHSLGLVAIGIALAFGILTASLGWPAWANAAPPLVCLSLLIVNRRAYRSMRRRAIYETSSHRAAGKIAGLIIFYLLFVALSALLGFALTHRFIAKEYSMNRTVLTDSWNNCKSSASINAGSASLMTGRNIRLPLATKLAVSEFCGAAQRPGANEDLLINEAVYLVLAASRTEFLPRQSFGENGGRYLAGIAKSSPRRAEVMIAYEAARRSDGLL